MRMQARVPIFEVRYREIKQVVGRERILAHVQALPSVLTNFDC